MTIKLVFGRRYPFVRVSEDRVDLAEVQRRENEALREKLVAAQAAKVTALKQAEELRKEKERLRVKVASLKQAGAQDQRMIAELHARIGDLQEELRRNESGAG